MTGTLASTVGQANPFRYRGYYYDTETGLYYLQTRYYDPEVGRFLNADGYIGANGDIIGYNMYAYCSNNPANSIDSSGCSLKSFFQRVTRVVKEVVEFAVNVYNVINDNSGIISKTLNKMFNVMKVYSVVSSIKDYINTLENLECAKYAYCTYFIYYSRTKTKVNNDALQKYMMVDLNTCLNNDFAYIDSFMGINLEPYMDIYKGSTKEQIDYLYNHFYLLHYGTTAFSLTKAKKFIETFGFEIRSTLLSFLCDYVIFFGG